MSHTGPAPTRTQVRSGGDGLRSVPGRDWPGGGGLWTALAGHRLERRPATAAFAIGGQELASLIGLSASGQMGIPPRPPATASSPLSTANSWGPVLAVNAQRGHAVSSLRCRGHAAGHCHWPALASTGACVGCCSGWASAAVAGQLPQFLGFAEVPSPARGPPIPAWRSFHSPRWRAGQHPRGCWPPRRGRLGNGRHRGRSHRP